MGQTESRSLQVKVLGLIFTAGGLEMPKDKHATSSIVRCRYSTLKLSIRGWRSTMCREEGLTGQKAEVEDDAGEEDEDEEEGGGTEPPAAASAASDWLGGPNMPDWLASLEKLLHRGDRCKQQPSRRSRVPDSGFRTKAVFNRPATLERALSHEVVKLGNTAVVEALLRAGSDPNLRDPVCGLTVMHDAAREGFVESVRALVDYGADLNLVDEQGNLPLHLAAREGHLEATQMLIGRTADPRAPNGLGHTAGQLAHIHKRVECAKYIHDYLSSHRQLQAQALWAGGAPAVCLQNIHISDI
ncbi:Cyclin-dependent kinase 4 inhibitor C [Liparis tanakae]|uniref:Cyclin-dependent kinase 4 inhibitor C n=1 Tax=Liparis tanakae TaxID=230148 RepID=A0A4Z2IB61_9TELE|nr:Cyclin-dependent kinase 4 inhibitor C [Liparis tanakae]